MAPKEIDEVEERITELQSRLDDLQSTLGRLHHRIDLIVPLAAGADAGEDAAEIDLDGPEHSASDVIDLREADRAR